MGIKPDKITNRQKLTIEKGLCDYKYIMENWKSNDADFQAVYYDFYLSARWAVMSKPENKNLYFEMLQSISSDADLLEVVDALREKMEKHYNEFSIVSKMLHTRNTSRPIYDKKVRKYLVEQEDVKFWWNESGAPKNASVRDKIKHDWELLCDWYQVILASKRGKEWIAWFDTNFPTYKYISDVKKVDFIVLATN